jgi:hypothetical protein
MSKILTAAGLLFLCALFLICGCSDDDDAVTPPTTGSITISPLPADLQAPWQLSGPDDYDESGRGHWTFSSMTPGSYTLAWGDTAGWETPDPADLT